MPLSYQASIAPIRAGIADPLLSAVAIAAAALAVNETVEITSPSLNTLNPLNGLRPMEGKGNDEATDWSIGSIYNPTRKRVYHAAAPAGYNVDEHAGSGICIYDVESNQWRRIQNPWNVAIGHAYDGHALDDEGILYRTPIGNGRILRWDTNTEMALPQIDAPPTTLGTAGSIPWLTVSSISFHPAMGVKGSLIFQNGSGPRTLRWDKNSEVWSVLVEDYSPATNYYPYCHYNPESGVIVTGNEGATGSAFLIDESETVISSTAIPQPIMTGGAPTNNQSLFIPAPNSVKSLLFCPVDSKIYALDTVTGVWDSGIAMPATMTASSLHMLNSKIGVTLHEFNCVLIAEYGSAGTSKLHAYRYS